MSFLALLLNMLNPLNWWKFLLGLIAIPSFFAGLPNIVQELFEQLKNLFIPPKPDSWQTLLWLSIFSWGMSLLAGTAVQHLIASIGWLFLIAALHWGMHEKASKELFTVNQVFLVPWITGALLCLFLFATPNYLPPIAFVSWPLISATIAALPRFIKSGPELAIPDAGKRQDLVILLLGNLVLSCWIRLFFSAQIWVQEYPSLVLVPERSDTGAIVQPSPGQVIPVSVTRAGILLLDRAGNDVKATFDGLSWPAVERELLDFNSFMSDLRVTSQGALALRDQAQWQLQGQVSTGTSLPTEYYNVRLLAIRVGGSTESSPSYGPFYLAKDCRIAPSLPSSLESLLRRSPQVRVAQVTCGATSEPIRGQP
jgi:hypothetical protein